MTCDLMSVVSPQVATRVLSDNTCQLIDNLVTSLHEKVEHLDVSVMAYKLNADLRALNLVYSNVEVPIAPPNNIVQTLNCLLAKVKSVLEMKSPSSKSL